MSRKNCQGFAPLAILAVVFMVASLVSVTAVTNNPVKNFAITSWAKVREVRVKTWRDIGSPSAGRHAGKIAEQQAAQEAAVQNAKLRDACEADKATGKGNYICDTPGGLQEYSITQPQQVFQETIKNQDLTSQEEQPEPVVTQTAPQALVDQYGRPLVGPGGEAPSTQAPTKTITEPPHVTYEKTDDGFIRTETTITRKATVDGSLGDIVSAESVRTQTKVNTAVKAYQDSLLTWHYIREDTKITINPDTGDVIRALVFTYPVSQQEINNLKTGLPLGAVIAPVQSTIEDYKAVAIAQADADQIKKLVEQCGKYCDSNRDLETFALTLLQQADTSQGKVTYTEAKKSFDQRYAGGTINTNRMADTSKPAETKQDTSPLENILTPSQAQSTLAGWQKFIQNPFAFFVNNITGIYSIISGTNLPSTPSQNQASSGFGQLLNPNRPLVPGQTVQLPLGVAPVSQPSAKVPYKGYVAPDQAPKDLQTVAYLTDLFNAVMKDQGIPDMNDYKAKAVFIAEVKKRLIATKDPQLIELANSKTFTDYFAGDRVARSELFGFYQDDIKKKQLLNCNQWAIGVSLLFPDLHIVADQYAFQNGGVFSNVGVFSPAETKSLTAGCNSSIGGALSKCSGALKFGISGDVSAYRFTDFGSINKGDSFAYGEHFGVILDKYLVNGKYYFMITEANSPKGNLDGQPQTYLVSQDDFASRVNDLSKTYFLRLNKYDQGTTPASQPTPGVLAEVKNYASQVVSTDSTPAITSGGGLPAAPAPATNETVPDAAYVVSPSGQKFLYWNQFDFKSKKYEIQGMDNLFWANKGCGIMVGAMVTNKTPDEYYKIFYDEGYRFTIPNNIKNTDKVGTKTQDHFKVFESLGYNVIHISKDEVNKYTSEGTPVVADTTMLVGGSFIPHLAEVIGVKDNGNYLVNDPAGWPGREMTDKEINHKDSLNLYAIVPPSN